MHIALALQHKARALGMKAKFGVVWETPTIPTYYIRVNKNRPTDTRRGSASVARHRAVVLLSHYLIDGG